MSEVSKKPRNVSVFSSASAVQPKQSVARQGVLQQKIAGLPQQSSIVQPARTPVAPPVYRPQPTPKILQTKTGSPQPLQPVQHSRPPVTRPLHHLHLTPRASQQGIATRTPASAGPKTNAARLATPPVSHHKPGVLQSKMNGSRPAVANGEGIRASALVIRPATKPRAIQRFSAGIVQATKYYPNLHPGAATPVDRSNIFALDSFADQYRLHRMNSHAVNVPNMKYNFVRNREGQMLLHNRYRHPSLAEGQQVIYAGEIFFNNGKLEWWSNGSGHYQPDEDGAEQANLPMDYFYSYQQILKGEHARK